MEPMTLLCIAIGLLAVNSMFLGAYMRKTQKHIDTLYMLIDVKRR